MASLRLVRRTFTCHEQQFVTSGGFSGNLAGKALGIIAGRAELFEFPYGSNADEGDSRVWRHALRHQHAMVYSPDTDTFHIGLPLVCGQSVFVQLDMPGSRERSYISLNALQSSFMADPDLQCVPANKKCRTLQVAFIATGCDYVSFFRSIGKTFFMNTLVKNAAFITGGSRDDGVPGMLCDTENEYGFLAFVRLIGCAYHQKHTAGFEDNGPRSLLSRQQGATSEERHTTWLSDIRKVVWSRVEPEEDCPPSWSALRLHWQRVCWVANMWAQANQDQVNVLDPNKYGWRTDGNAISVVWDTEEHMAAVRSRVMLLTRGCSCKSGCVTRRCKCYRSGRCGPGCKCTGCKNVVSNVVSEDSNIHHSNPESEESGSDEDSDDDADEDANDGTVQHGEPLDEHTPQPALVDTTTPAEIEEEHMEP